MNELSPSSPLKADPQVAKRLAQYIAIYTVCVIIAVKVHARAKLGEVLIKGDHMLSSFGCFTLHDGLTDGAASSKRCHLIRALTAISPGFDQARPRSSSPCLAASRCRAAAFSSSTSASLWADPRWSISRELRGGEEVHRSARAWHPRTSLPSAHAETPAYTTALEAPGLVRKSKSQYLTRTNPAGQRFRVR